MLHDDCRTAVLKDELTPAVQAHLECCPNCAALARAVAAMKADVRAPLPDPERLVARMLLASPAGGTRARREPTWSRPRLTAAARRRFAALIAALAVALAGALVVGQASGGAVATHPLTGDCDHGAATAEQPGGQRAAGDRRVVVAGVWSGAEQDAFLKVLERFEQKSGAQVTFLYTTHDIADTLKTRIDHGCPPDVALLPQPGLMNDLALRRAIAPLAGIADREVRANYGPSWQKLSRSKVDGKLYGVWFKAANKSLLWYNRQLLDRVGVSAAPRTWTDLTALATQLRDAHIAPFAVAGADGWTLTDWFENVYMASAGPRLYDKLAAHEIPWTHPSVKRALRLLGQIFAKPGSLAAGSSGALQDSYKRSVKRVFGVPATAAMLVEGSFVQNEIAGLAQRVAPQGVAVADFPMIGAARRPVIVGGDIAVLFSASRRNDAAAELIRFLASPDAAEPWADIGGFISPNKNFDPSGYRDPVTARLAREIVTRPVRFDLSDLQPPAFGSSAGQGMWELLRRYLEHPRELDSIMRALENKAGPATRCALALQGEC